jgi:pimeloyl-ACP methyl ester carboxylesterase
VSETLQSRFFTASDGLNLHALVHGEESATTPIVCLPGLTRPARDFSILARHLHAKKARRIISIDYRGRGGSDWDPDWSHYSFPVESGDILTVLDQLGVASAIFIGLSRGGMHALYLGGQRPGLVKALVLNDVGPALNPVGLLRIKKYIGRLPVLRNLDEAIAHYKRVLGASFPAVPDEHWRFYAEYSLDTTPERMRLSYDPRLAQTLESFDPEKPLPDLWPLFTALTAPILALRGEHSDLLTPETHAEMAARHPLCQIHIVPGQGHAPLLLDSPTLDRIADFIDEADGIGESSLAQAGEISGAER